MSLKLTATVTHCHLDAHSFLQFGLGFGVAARVGNLLGAMLPGAARVSASVGFALGLTLMLVSGAPMLFTSEPDILDHFERIAPLMFVSLLLIGGAQSLMASILMCFVVN